MTGILAASQFWNSTPTLGDWINRSPTTTDSGLNSVITFVNFGGEIYGMFSRFSGGNCRILKTNNSGVSWTRINAVESLIGSAANSSNYEPQLRSLNGRLVTVNFKSFIYSSDGANWSNYDLNPSFAPTRLSDIGYNGTTWVASGFNQSSPARQIWRSTASFPTSSSDWGAGIVASSTNNFNGNGSRAITYAFNKWWIIGPAVTSQPSLYESSDGGLNWTANSSAASITQGQSIPNMFTLFYVNNVLFGLSTWPNETRYIYSTDGVNFSQGSFDFTSSTVYSITYSPELEQYAAISDTNVGYSSNGTSWTADNTLSTTWGTSPITGRTIHWTGNGYLAGNGAGQVAYRPLI